MRRVTSLLALALLLFTACDGSEDAAATTTTTTVADTLADPGTTAPTSSSAGDNGTTTAPIESAPLTERLEFVTELFNGAELTEGDYQGAFTADFIANVPHAEMVAVLEDMAATATDWSISEFEQREDRSAVVLMSSPGEADAFRVQIGLESVVPYRIEALLVQPAEPPTLDDPPADLEAAADRLAALGTTRVLVAEVVDGVCQPVLERSADEPAPIGSAFKLYVLGAVADAVERGDLAWDDTVTISNDLKSIPTGVLQDEEEGTEFTVREVAEAMISISDNTATDHLIDLVGREAVEAAFADYGMTDPGLNIPLMDTMDFAALKVGPASGLATQWVDADTEGRRAILQQISDIGPADIPLAEFDHPLSPDQIEWFAAPADMCRVLVELGERGEPTTQILSINPGIPDDGDLFETIWFKGGSEPGLVAMNFLVERPDGGRFVVAGSVVDPEQEFDQLEATLLFGSMRDLVGNE